MLTSIGYVPLLRTKVAEVDAYKNLSHGVKDAILPVFLGRPYPNAGHLALTVDRVVEAVDGRPFGFGLDPAKQNDPNPRAAQREFDALFESGRGFSSYYSFVNGIDGAIPILQPTRNPDNLLIQLGRAEDIDRGLIVHVKRDSFSPVLNIAGSTPPYRTTRFS
jgi:hypothetical protein